MVGCDLVHPFALAPTERCHGPGLLSCRARDEGGLGVASQVAHVMPEFQSPHGHMRAKAAWVAGQYADINFKQPQHFMALLQCIVQGLRDPELPVRCALLRGLSA